MYGELIHTEHRIETVSEYYFDAKQKMVTELKSLTNNRVKTYSYTLQQFRNIHKDSRINTYFHKLGL